MKYNIRFCKCGRVHFFDYEKMDKVCSEGKVVLTICNNCKEMFYNWYTEDFDGYYVNVKNAKEKEINPSNIGLILDSYGEKIFMKTGLEATYYANGCFVDLKNEGKVSLDDRKIVDTQKTILSINDEEKLLELSYKGVKIDWSNTKYSR